MAIEGSWDNGAPLDPWMLRCTLSHPTGGRIFGQVELQPDLCKL
jgi:hypothetical protein